jgi:hypothetical protein
VITVIRLFRTGFAAGYAGHLKAYGERKMEVRTPGRTVGRPAPASSFYYRHVLKLSTDVDALYSHLKKPQDASKGIEEGFQQFKATRSMRSGRFHHLPPDQTKRPAASAVPFFSRLYDHIIGAVRDRSFSPRIRENNRRRDLSAFWE